MEEQKDGMYVAVNWSQPTKYKIKEFINKFNIENVLDLDKIHTTLIYSRKYAKIEVNPDARYIAYPKSVEKWKTQTGKTALVINMQSYGLEERHNYLMSVYDLTYDYDKYKAHITISYDADENINVNDMQQFLMNCVFVSEGEYAEDLVLDWADKN